MLMSEYTDGGKTVTISGANFYNNADLMCMFGGIKTVATYLSPSSLQCETPRHAAGTVTVSVSTNNQDFLTNSLIFTYGILSCTSLLTVL